MPTDPIIKLQGIAKSIQETVKQKEEELLNVSSLVAVEDGDQAAINEEMTALKSELKRLEVRFRSVQKAIRLAKDGEYGICASCGADIEERRLEVRPESTECIECKTSRELKDKHYA